MVRNSADEVGALGYRPMAHLAIQATASTGQFLKQVAICGRAHLVPEEPCLLPIGLLSGV